MITFFIFHLGRVMFSVEIQLKHAHTRMDERNYYCEGTQIFITRNFHAFQLQNWTREYIVRVRGSDTLITRMFCVFHKFKTMTYASGREMRGNAKDLFCWFFYFWRKIMIPRSRILPPIASDRLGTNRLPSMRFHGELYLPRRRDPEPRSTGRNRPGEANFRGST
jgi:hypothetical protein